MCTRLITSLIVFGVLIASCKQKLPHYDMYPYPKSTIMGEWRYISITSDTAVDWTGNGVTSRNKLVALRPCDQDDIFIFRSGGGFRVYEGGAVCRPGDSKLKASGSYDIDNFPKLRILDKEVQIILLNDTALSYQLVEPTANGFDVTVTYTLGR